ncbi:MAG: hypothetical protein AAGA36_11315 [Pseudomonadota bacterium]
MATVPRAGMFSYLLEQSLKKNGLGLEDDARRLLDQMEQYYLSSLTDERIEMSMVEDSVDKVTQQILGLGVDRVDALNLQNVIDFFCPGLPPIC